WSGAMPRGGEAVREGDRIVSPAVPRRGAVRGCGHRYGPVRARHRGTVVPQTARPPLENLHRNRHIILNTNMFNRVGATTRSPALRPEEQAGKVRTCGYGGQARAHIGG